MTSFYLFDNKEEAILFIFTCFSPFLLLLFSLSFFRLLSYTINLFITFLFHFLNIYFWTFKKRLIIYDKYVQMPKGRSEQYIKLEISYMYNLPHSVFHSFIYSKINQSAQQTLKYLHHRYLQQEWWTISKVMH